MMKAARSETKTFFNGAMIGYFIAILTTVAIMIYFDHGQPALLYLVPGCLLSVLVNAARKGQLKTIWEFDEANVIGSPK